MQYIGETKGIRIFSERLTELMDGTQTTQKALAEKIKASRQTISLYMDGSTIPSAEKLSSICDYFNVSCDYLLGFTNSQSREISDHYIKDSTGLSNESIKSLKAVYHGTYPNQLFATPSDLDMGVINYLLSDEVVIQNFLKKLFTYFYEKQENEQIINEQYKDNEETDHARYLLQKYMDQVLESCYQDFFKPYHTKAKPKCKPGRKRKELTTDDNTNNERGVTDGVN